MFNSAKYIGWISTLTRASGHFVNKAVQIVDKHKKIPPFCARFLGIGRFYCLLVVGLRSCTIHKMRDANGRSGTQTGDAARTAHCPNPTAMATTLRLITAMPKNERSHCCPFRKRLIKSGMRQATDASNQATASGDWQNPKHATAKAALQPA